MRGMVEASPMILKRLVGLGNVELKTFVDFAVNPIASNQLKGE
jgi:hypothetical protein